MLDFYKKKPVKVGEIIQFFSRISLIQAGNYSKALDLAFTTKQFGALQLISSDLDERADPELLQRCADFFLENGQYDKAVDLLAIGKKVICMRITIFLALSWL